MGALCRTFVDGSVWFPDIQIPALTDHHIHLMALAVHGPAVKQDVGGLWI